MLRLRTHKAVPPSVPGGMTANLSPASAVTPPLPLLPAPRQRSHNTHEHAATKRLAPFAGGAHDTCCQICSPLPRRSLCAAHLPCSNFELRTSSPDSATLVLTDEFAPDTFPHKFELLVTVRS